MAWLKNPLELSLSQFWILAAISLGAVSALVFIIRRKAYPDLPTLRLSTKPGAVGVMEDTLLWQTDCMKLYDAGYQKYSKFGQHYLINTPNGKEVVLSSKYVEEVRRAPDTHVSNLAANNVIMQLGHTLHPALMWDQYHFDTPIRKSLTRSLGPKLLDIVEEAQMSLDDQIGRPNEWKLFPMWPVSFNLVARTANRLLFGVNLARDPEFLKLSIDYTKTMFGGAHMIRDWPHLLKPVVMYFKTGIYAQQAIARKHLVPILTQRIADEDRYASEGRLDEWAKIKAEDTIQWVLDVSPPKERDPRRLVYRMLHINIAAVHTSSVTFLDNAYCLALHPEIHDEIREEITRVFEEEKGWTKQGLTKLAKLDSFMREVSRLCASATKLKRQTIRDWRLSDGTLLPSGNTLCVNDHAAMLDPDVYSSTTTFDPFYAYKLRQTSGQEHQHQFVMTSEKHLAFGHGKHACPGRFFASNEIKTLLTIILMRYEMKMDFEGGLKAICKGQWFGDSRVPLTTGMIQFRARKSDDKIMSLKYF